MAPDAVGVRYDPFTNPTRLAQHQGPDPTKKYMFKQQNTITGPVRQSKPSRGTVRVFTIYKLK